MLVAATPAAAEVLRRLLGEAFELQVADKLADARRIAADGGIGLVVCTIAFDESRMFDLIEALQRDAQTRGIPVLCCRVLPTILNPESLERIAETCRYFGAADFLDVVKLAREAGEESAGAALTQRILAMAL